MPKITIDNIDYDSEDLSGNGKAQLASLQFLEDQMLTIHREITAYQLAQKTYVAALKIEIEQLGLKPLTRDKPWAE